MMEFEKKMRVRLYVAISYVLIGVLMTALFCGLVMKNDYIFALGIAFVVMGVLRLWKYFRTTKSEESMRRQQVVESDERNVSIAQRARSAAFRIYTLMGCAAVIVLEVMGRGEAVKILAGQVCALLVIYWVSYFIIRNKS